MFWEPEIESSFRVLNNILLAAMVALLITQLSLKEVRAMQLFVLFLLYVVNKCERSSLYIFKLFIILGIGCVLNEAMQLLYLCFGEENTIASPATLDSKKYVNVLVVEGLWMLIMIYAILLCWRAYEKNKLFIILTNELASQ